MTQPNRAAERNHFSTYRAELMFSRHLRNHPRARTPWLAAIDEGTEPADDILELQRRHIRNALLGSRWTPPAAPR